MRSPSLLFALIATVTACGSARANGGGGFTLDAAASDLPATDHPTSDTPSDVGMDVPAPQDVATQPDTTSADVVTPPTDVVTPPTDVVTPPTDVVTPPTDVVTPPTDVVTPPADRPAPVDAPAADVVAPCPGMQTRCAGRCVELSVDVAHCGACGNACPVGRLCSAGVCIIECRAGLTVCDSVCRDLATDLAHCGRCNTPCAAANATTSCAMGQCRVASCSAGYSDCNARADDGCETVGPCLPIAGLVAHYPLDGDGADLGPSAIRATVSGATPTTDRFGRANRAMRFAGAAMSALGHTRLPTGAGARTMSLWLRAASPAPLTAPFRVMALWGSAGSGRRFGLTLVDERGLLTGQDRDVPGRTRVADGRWHHLVAVYDGGTATLWVDGRVERAIPMALDTAGQSLWIGRNPDNPSEDLSGDVDDLRVFNRALSMDEIRTLGRENAATCVPNTTVCGGDTGVASCGPTGILTLITCGAGSECRSGACVTAAPTAGLVARYSLDWGAVSRSEYVGPEGTGFNESMAVDRFGHLNDALRFDPDRGSYLEFMPNPALPQGRAPRTMSIWMRTTRPAGGPDYRAALTYGDPVGGERFGISNYLDTAIFTGEGPGFDLSSQVQVTDDRWHLVAVTFDGSNLSIYVDGFRAARAPRVLYTAGDVLRVGRTPAGHPGTDFFPGLLDDPRVYNRVLSDNEIQALYRENNYMP